MRRTAVRFAICALTAGCAPVEKPTAAPSALLSLYTQAYVAGAIGFSCVPAAYPRGPMRADIAHERDRLYLKLRRARARIATIIGERAIEEAERSFQYEEAQIDRRCTPSATQRSRMRYRSLLARLERAIGRTISRTGSETAN